MFHIDYYNVKEKYDFSLLKCHFKRPLCVQENEQKSQNRRDPKSRDIRRHFFFLGRCLFNRLLEYFYFIYMYLLPNV